MTCFLKMLAAWIAAPFCVLAAVAVLAQTAIAIDWCGAWLARHGLTFNQRARKSRTEEEGPR